MPYKMKEYEWLLTPKEQEKAKWILEHRYLIDPSVPVLDKELWMAQLATYQRFRHQLYQEVCSRLFGLPLAEGEYAITKDGTKLIGYRVEAVESPEYIPEEP